MTKKTINQTRFWFIVWTHVCILWTAQNQLVIHDKEKEPKNGRKKATAFLVHIEITFRSNHVPKNTNEFPDAWTSPCTR
jgi:hypothetical protein